MKKLIFVFILSFGLNLFGAEKIFFLENENLKMNDIRGKLKVSEDKARIDFYKKMKKINCLLSKKEFIKMTKLIGKQEQL